MQANARIKCIACGFHNLFFFKRPSFLCPIAFGAECEHCESELMIKVSQYKPSNQKTWHANANVKLLKQGVKLMEMVEAEKVKMKEAEL